MDWNTATTLVMGGFLALFFFHLLRYYLGKVFYNDSWVANAKMGLERWLEGIFLFIIFSFLITSSDAVMGTILSATGWDRVAAQYGLQPNNLTGLASVVVNNHIAVAESFLKDQMNDLRISSLFTQTQVGFNTIYAAFLQLSYSHDTVYNFKTKKAQALIDYANMALIPLLTLKGYLDGYAYPLGMLFLLFGVLFKAAPYLDRVGATMIALGVASLYVLPLLTIFFLSPSLVYSSTQAGSCPSYCQSTIVGVSDSSPDAEVITWQEVALSDVQNKEAFLQGEVDSIEIDGTTYHSCEYYSKPTPTELEAYIGSSSPELIEEYSCKSFCRLLPFPNVAQCRKAEPFCRELYDRYPACFKPLFSSAALNKEVFYKGQPMPLAEALAHAKCFTLKPLLPIPSSVKDRYPFPIPEACRSFYIYYDEANQEWRASLQEECRQFLSQLKAVDALLGDEVEGEVMDALQEADASASALISGVEQYLLSGGEFGYAEAPPEAYNWWGFYVREDCGDVKGVTLSDTSLYYAEDCSTCASQGRVGIGLEDKLAFLLTMGWGATAMAVGSTAMFIVSFSVALSGFMFIPALGRLV